MATRATRVASRRRVPGVQLARASATAGTNAAACMVAPAAHNGAGHVSSIQQEDEGERHVFPMLVLRDYRPESSVV